MRCPGWRGGGASTTLPKPVEAGLSSTGSGPGAETRERKQNQKGRKVTGISRSWGRTREEDQRQHALILITYPSHDTVIGGEGADLGAGTYDLDRGYSLGRGVSDRPTSTTRRRRRRRYGQVSAASHKHEASAAARHAGWYLLREGWLRFLPSARTARVFAAMSQ